MNDLFMLVLSLSLSGSIIALGLFALRPLIKEHLSKTWQYYVWLIVIVRMLIPFSTDISLIGKLFNEIQSTNRVDTTLTEQWHDSANIMQAIEPKQYTDEQTTVNNLPEPSISHNIKGSVFDYLGSIWIIWVLGALFLFMLKIYHYKRFLNLVKSRSFITKDEKILDLFYQVRKELGIKRKITLYESEVLKTPMLIGLFNPVVIIPENYLTLDGLNYVFKHELIHLKRFDIWYKWILQLTVCIHWFNPLMYIVSRQVSKLCELACDEAVSQGLDISKKMAYCNTILSVVSLDTAYKGNVFTMTLNEGKKNLKERLGNILTERISSKRIIVLSISIIVVLCFLAILLGAYSNSNDGYMSVKKQDVAAPNEEFGQVGLEQEQAFEPVLIEGKTVLIDPGHGGEDTGAVYIDNKTGINTNEKDLNLAVALLLRDMLQESGVNAELTRHEDQMTKLENRMALADKLNPCLFVSIHFNISNNRADNGTLTLYNSTKDSNTTIEGQKAAKLIQGAILNELKTNDMGIRAMSESLKYNSLKSPALIINLAYLTNALDRKKIMDKGFYHDAAKALNDGILAVINEA